MSTTTAATENYGSWLADQEWKPADPTWEGILDQDNRPLVEGVTDAPAAEQVPFEELKLALSLMQYSPRLLRFVLRALECLHDPKRSAATKVEHVRLLLEEVAGNVLGAQQQSSWRAVARAVQRRQATAGETD